MDFNFKLQPGISLHKRGLCATGQPLVSIITPYYNGGKYFEQTFNSVMNQTFPWFEWIIVDDGSTSEPDLILLEQFCARDPRIQVYHKENGGIATARNLGIQKASTDLILPLDCDDLLEPTLVEVCWWMLQKNPNAAWAYTDSVGFSGQEYLWSRHFNPIEEKKENLLTATALIRKSWLNKVGCYDEGHKSYNEDWVLWLKIISAGGYPVQATNEFLFWYRRSETGVLATVKADPTIAKENARLLENAAKRIKNPNPPILFPCPFKLLSNMSRPAAWECSIFTPCDTHIRVAFLIPWTVMGGADKFVLDLISGLNKSRFDVGVITTLNSQNEWCQRFRSVCDDVFNLPNFMAVADYAEFISYYIKSRKLNILVVSNTYVGFYLVPWLRQQFPDLVIIDYVHMEEWYWRQGGHARASGVLGGIIDRTYVCNSVTRQVLIDSFGRDPESVKTIHVGVDEGYFNRSTIEPGQTFEELNIDASRPIVLFICRLHPQKRPFLMLEIAKQVRSKIPNIAFVVVGKGELEKQLKSRVRMLGLKSTVYFLGEKSDLRPYYRDAKVTLVCSLKEGLSLTTYESCSMGVPVISSDVGGQKDLVDETVGALVPCLQDEIKDINTITYSNDEIELYVASLVRILTDNTLWQKMSRSARIKIEQNFTIRQMVKYFENEFIRITSSSSERTRRHEKSKALQLVKPLAEETYSLLLLAEFLSRTPPIREKIRDKLFSLIRRFPFVSNVSITHLKSSWCRFL